MANARPAGMRVGVDVGGTFTDAVLLDENTGSIRRAKVPTTPHDQSEGTLEAIRQLGIEPQDMSVFCHGFTVGLNALLTRAGARTGLLCTEGMRELLDMGRLRRPAGDGLYDARWMRPHQARPIVHRRHIREVSERLRADGTVHVELDEDRVRREVRFLRDEGVTSIAVCLLHAYLNPAHEERVQAIIAEEYPEAYVQTSAARSVVGEYIRTSAAVVDAYIGPIISEYLNRLGQRLDDSGYGAEALVMQMNAGVRTLRNTVDRLPLNSIESGPVAGMVGAKLYTVLSASENVICVDIGGTSTDIGIINAGEVTTTENYEFEFNMPLGVPAVDVRSIGAGGGSIIHVDSAGTLCVGPQSAGSDPGPACYGFGGTEPTVTDAYVALGVLRPELFLGGKMELSKEAALSALKTVAAQLEMDPLELAEGAVRLMTANIANEIMKLVHESGLDVQDFTLMAYGGAGPLMAVDIAVELGIRDVLIPVFPGGFAALGMVVAPFKVETATSVVEPLDQLSLDRLNELLHGMEDWARAELRQQGVEPEKVTAALYGMYAGQSFDNKVVLGELPVTAEAVEAWKERFHALYEVRYGYSAPEMAIVITTLAVEATAAETPLSLPSVEEGDAAPRDEAKEVQAEMFIRDQGWSEVPFYDRAALCAGNVVPGPAVVDDGLATILIPPGATGRVDGVGNLRLGLGEQGQATLGSVTDKEGVPA